MSTLPNALNVPMATLGYNGEAHELHSRWQLLGAGYRAYNPALMRFHSADTLSPFGRGGFNAYAYCSNDPVNRIDPSGHFNWYALAALVIGGGTAAGSYFMPNEMAAQTMLYTGAAVGILGVAGLAYSGVKFLYGGKRSLGPGGVPGVPGRSHSQPLIPQAKLNPPPPGGPRPQPSTRSASFSSASSVSGGSSLSSRRGSTNSTKSLTPSERAALDTFEYGYNQGFNMGQDSALFPTMPIASTSVPAPAPVSTPLPVQTQATNGAGGQSFTFNFFMGEGGSRGLSTSNANTNIRA